MKAELGTAARILGAVGRSSRAPDLVAQEVQEDLPQIGKERSLACGFELADPIERSEERRLHEVARVGEPGRARR
jgi:hypothetical protein